jgi:hypothetical protein
MLRGNLQDLRGNFLEVIYLVQGFYHTSIFYVLTCYGKLHQSSFSSATRALRSLAKFLPGQPLTENVRVTSRDSCTLVGRITHRR